MDTAIVKWESSVNDLKQQISKINKVYLDTELSKPTQDQFSELRRALGDFTKSTTLFRQTYEEEIQVELGRRYYNIDDTLAVHGVIPKDAAPHNAPLIGLGEVASACWDKHTGIYSILSEIENIWSLMKTCMANGQILDIKTQSVFGAKVMEELLDQVKILKNAAN